MNVVAEIQRLNERELELGVPLSGSWHQKYRESAWVFIGGLSFELSEGDVLCVLSQWGEIEDIHLVRDGKSGKSKGFVFVKFEDQRSTVLAVDNLNGFKLLDRVLRVDHVLKYKLPKELQEDSDDSDDEAQRKPRGLPGHAYEGKELASDFDLQKGVDVFKAPKESHKDKKKRKREEKKARKAAKKLRKVEKKQQELMQQVQQRRQEQRIQEQKEKDEEEMQASATGWRGRMEPTQASSTGWRGRMEPSAQPSSTGWRGRMEPHAPRPRKGERKQDDGRDEQDKSFGGMGRAR